jgi:4-hydroxy-tetrahydrodipicolinate synthase
MTEIGRLLTAMVTPFNPQGQVDFAQAKKLANALLDSGSDGVIISGTTGESPTLSSEEKISLFSEVKNAIGDRGAVIAGTGNYNTTESIELTKAAEQAGVDGAVLVVPYYNKPPQEGLFQHFKAIAQSVHIPCIVYNVTSRTSLNMAYDTTIRLSHIENIVGVKEAGGDLDQIARIIDGSKTGFRVWSGNDSETFYIMSMGGYGVASVASHLVGNQIKHMMELLLKGYVEKAAAEHRRLHSLFKVLFVTSNPIPIKHALNKVGFPVGNHRLPLIPPDEHEAFQIDQVISQYKIDLPITTSV